MSIYKKNESIYRNEAVDNAKTDSKGVEVTVIMPTYNCLEYLPKAVESVLSQNATLELIVIDDCSTDGSDEWLHQKSQQDARLKVIKGEHRGVSAARNLAIKEARGHWVAFLDADDYWYADKLEDQLAQLKKHPSCILSFTEYDHFGEKGEYLGTCFDFWPRFQKRVKAEGSVVCLSGEQKTSIYEENIIGTSTVVVQTSYLQAVEGFDETLFSASDWDLWLKISLLGDVLVHKKSTTNYLVRSNSISRNAERRIASVERILDRYRGDMETLNPECCAPAYARLYIAKAEAYQHQSGHYLSALNHYIKACSGLPTKRNFWALLSHFVKGAIHQR
ncbi:glycosyltransferase family 2 protein [Marinomonas mediterranea]|uniref:glycosyltransferase family 2 protein n=1 Tax=Marinomonas mediterranea TaxID=119864 RepID=UPI00234AF585|nr:glycosyltransferase family 2 protein [Marinomonas mediterranea]WCN08091.1 glycosyltransferase [Marinomonas mediterranea]